MVTPIYHNVIFSQSGTGQRSFTFCTKIEHLLHKFDYIHYYLFKIFIKYLLVIYDLYNTIAIGTRLHIHKLKLFLSKCNLNYYT